MIIFWVVFLLFCIVVWKISRPTELNKFKAYLAGEYAKGKPVVIVYPVKNKERPE